MDRVRKGGERAWTVEEFDDLGGSANATNAALRRLVADGELRRVRRGVYWRGRAGKFGMTPTVGREVARELVDRGEAMGAAEWSATNALGLSTQVPRQFALAVTQRAPRNLPDDVRIVRRDARRGRRAARLREPEVTLLEALDGWDRYVEATPAEALARFVEVVKSDNVRVDRLTQASSTEPAAVRERLRLVLEHAGKTKEAASVRRARDPRTIEKALRVVNL